jgi:DNA-binding NtrC family response regulator
MAAVFVIDRSVTEPSPLVQRLMYDGYHVLCLADCRTALETLRWVRPALMLVDVAARSRAAALGLLKILARDRTPRPGVPVMIVGASVDDYLALAGLMSDGEIVPGASSSPEEVARRVGRYVVPNWPPRPAFH